MLMANRSCQTYMSNFPSTAWNWTFGMINATNSITATFENAVALLIMVWYKECHSISDRIFTSLIITDLLAGLTTAPLYSVQLFSKDISSNCTVEQVRRSSSAILIAASALTVATISYDRFLHITKLNNYNKHMTKGKSLVFILLCWVVPVSLPILRIFAETQNYYVIAFSSLMALVFVIMIVFYVLILISIRKRGSWRRRSVQIEKQRMRTVKITITIITCYVLMGLPVMIPLILMPFQIEPETMGAIYVSAVTLNMLNSSANPVIYYYRNPSIRKCFKKLMRLDSTHDRTSSISRNNPAAARENQMAKDRPITIIETVETINLKARI